MPKLPISVNLALGKGGLEIDVKHGASSHAYYYGLGRRTDGNPENAFLSAQLLGKQLCPIKQVIKGSQLDAFSP